MSYILHDPDEWETWILLLAMLLILGSWYFRDPFS